MFVFVVVFVLLLIYRLGVQADAWSSGQLVSGLWLISVVLYCGDDIADIRCFDCWATKVINQSKPPLLKSPLRDHACGAVPAEDSEKNTAQKVLPT